MAGRVCARLVGEALPDGGKLAVFLATSTKENLLDRKGVFVRHGHHCTMPLHNWLNVPATVRASFGVYNNLDDVQRLADALRYVRQRLKLDT